MASSFIDDESSLTPFRKKVYYKLVHQIPKGYYVHMDQLQKNYRHLHVLLQWDLIHGDLVIKYHDIELYRLIERLVDLVILLAKSHQRYKRKDECWRRNVLYLVVMERLIC